jgi:hypothetical protein
MNHPSPIEPARQRASDADRELVVTALGEAFASGRLTESEHAERLDAAFAARTLAELEPLTSDLQVAAPSTVSAPPRRSVAALSKVLSHVRTTVPDHSSALSVLGALVLDLRQATFPRGEATITANAYLGKLVLLVPDDAVVDDSGMALLGKRSMLIGAPSAPGGPVIHLRGRVILGKVRVVRGDQGWRGW